MAWNHRRKIRLFRLFFVFLFGFIVITVEILSSENAPELIENEYLRWIQARSRLIQAFPPRRIIEGGSAHSHCLQIGGFSEFAPGELNSPGIRLGEFNSPGGEFKNAPRKHSEIEFPKLSNEICGEIYQFHGHLAAILKQITNAPAAHLGCPKPSKTYQTNVFLREPSYAFARG